QLVAVRAQRLEQPGRQRDELHRGQPDGDRQRDDQRRGAREPPARAELGGERERDQPGDHRLDPAQRAADHQDGCEQRRTAECDRDPVARAHRHHGRSGTKTSSPGSIGKLGRSPSAIFSTGSLYVAFTPFSMRVTRTMFLRAIGVNPPDRAMTSVIVIPGVNFTAPVFATIPEIDSVSEFISVIVSETIGSLRKPSASRFWISSRTCSAVLPPASTEPMYCTEICPVLSSA